MNHFYLILNEIKKRIKSFLLCQKGEMETKKEDPIILDPKGIEYTQVKEEDEEIYKFKENESVQFVIE